MRANKLELNPAKTMILWVGSNLTLRSGIRPVLDGVALPLKACVHSVVVLLAPMPLLNVQVVVVARNA